MFGELVTAYLFLAGVGAGGVAVASVADLLLVREPFGADVVPDFAEKRPAERLVVGVLALSCGARLILDCLDRRLVPSWDAHNLPSVSLAEKLGYRLRAPYQAYLLNLY